MEQGQAFKLKNTGFSSERYGNCECCGHPVNAVYHLTSMKSYKRHDGTMGLTHYRGISRFGHYDCLSALTG